MSIRLINSLPLAAEFHIKGDKGVTDEIPVDGKAEASYATSALGTAQQWTVYAIVNGITTNTVETDNPDATVRLAAAEQNRYFLAVS